MEKKSNNCSLEAICEKIYNKITCSDTLKPIESKPSHHNGAKHNNEEAQPIPVNFNYTRNHPSTDHHKPIIKSSKPHKPIQTDTKIESSHHEGNKQLSGIHIEDRFTEYINRAKIKLRTMTTLGRTKSNVMGSEENSSHGHGDHHHRDLFMEYINRAKLKIRATSSVTRRSASSVK